MTIVDVVKSVVVFFPHRH